MPEFGQLAHLDLSVSDVDASVEWYSTVLGLRFIRREDFGTRTTVLLKYDPTGLFLGLSQHQRDGGAPPRFDERDPGLDHIAFQVASSEELQAWQQRFEELGVTHSPIREDASGVGDALVFRDPDNIQLELWWNRPR